MAPKIYIYIKYYIFDYQKQMFFPYHTSVFLRASIHIAFSANMCTCLGDDNVIYSVIHVDYCPTATDKSLSISSTALSATWFIELCQKGLNFIESNQLTQCLHP